MADDRQKAVATANAYDQGDIKGLDDAMTRRLVASVVLTESSGGNLAVTNAQGYVGRYQAGASWLVEAGYVNRGKFDAAFEASGYKSEWAWAKSGGMTRFLENDANWNNGLDLDKYKASADLQDKAFRTNCDKLYDRAVRNGLLDADDAPGKVAGFLKASHLGGYGAGRAVLEGRPVRSDANGTSPYKYYNDIVRDGDGLDRQMGRTRSDAQPTQTSPANASPTSPADPTQTAATRAPASHAIYNEAYQHFLAGGNKYEYGRGDISLTNREGDGKSDRSRTEQDLDGDGLKGVDCSSFVWRGLKNAGYDVGNEPFTTHKLFNGSQISEYSKQNFDVIPATDAKRANGKLEPGDIILFKDKDKDSGGQHVGIFKGYDDKGNIQFIGSQVSTGPAQANAGPGSYWNGGEFEIVGALRAKPEFQVRAPLNGTPEVSTTQGRSNQPAGADGQLKRDEQGPEIAELQKRLNKLGYGRADGTPLVENGRFGPNTEAAVIRFQKDHDLQGLGVVGPKTMAALDAAEKAQAQGAQSQGGQAQGGQTQGGQTQAKTGISLDAAHAMSLQYDHVKYGFGDKDLSKGTVDCSGWVSQLQNATMEEINRKAGKDVFSGKDFFSVTGQTAADIVKDSVQTTGTQMRSPLDASKLKEGMIIGEDNGQKGWDKGRYNGIDHITMVVKDPKTGQLMVSQSRSGEGVELTTLDKYLERKQAKGVELFATDPLAKARPLIEGQQTTQERATDTRTTGAIEKQQAPLLSDPKHPDNGLYRQALKGLEQLPPGTFKSAQERDNAAAALAFEAKVGGLTQIDHVKQANGGAGLFVVQGGLDDPSHRRAYVDQQQAGQQSVQKSTELAQQVQVAQVEDRQQRETMSRSVA